MRKEYPIEVRMILQMLIDASNGVYLEETTRQFAEKAIKAWDETR